jgi:hypothetical protein
MVLTPAGSLTNAHRKSLRHHKTMLAIFVAWFNFCKHETIKQTPAMAAKLVGRQWTVRELIQQAASTDMVTYPPAEPGAENARRRSVLTTAISSAIAAMATNTESASAATRSSTP